MIKPKQILVAAVSCIFAQSAFSMDKSEAQAKWTEVNSALIKGIDGKPAQIFLLRNIVTDSGNCYGINGKELETEKCDAIFSDAKELQAFRPAKAATFKAQLESVDEATKENLSQFLSELRKKVDAQEKGLDKKAGTQKESSKECQIYRLTVDLCRMTSIEDSTKVTTEHENEVTKNSGIINKYNRYKIGQMNAFHRTKDIPTFKSKYKSLVGKEWSQSSCEVSEEQERAAAKGDYDPIHEEVENCGCSRDPNSNNQCSQ